MRYNSRMVRAGITESNRVMLEKLHRELRRPFDISEAAKVLSIDKVRAKRFLSYLASRGWLTRVRHGLYITVPLDATEPSQWHEDPWIVAHSIFSPGYIAGWSACEHWGLTEQIFRDIAVCTTRRIRNRRMEVQGTPFRIKVIAPSKLFGTRPVWRREIRVLVSDPSRTIIDLLDDPSFGGGIQHVADVLRAYFAGETRDDKLLIEYAERFGNRTVFKRLGYLVEHLSLNASDLVANCQRFQSTNIATLDPSVRLTGRIIQRWNLRVNVLMKTEIERS